MYREYLIRNLQDRTTFAHLLASYEHQASKMPIHSNVPIMIVHFHHNSCTTIDRITVKLNRTQQSF
jgi:hypothetical protein